MKNLLNYCLVCVVISIAVLTSGCSYSIGFFIKNKSENPIVVTYITRDFSEMEPELVTIENGKDGRRPIPDERFRVEREKGVVEFTMLPNEEVELFRVPSRLEEKDYRSDFNIHHFEISGEEGSIGLSGDLLYEKFRPERAPFFSFGPSITAFVYEYE